MFYMQCLINRASHTRPLVTLLGAQGDRVEQYGNKIQRLFLPLLDLCGHSSYLELNI